MKTLVVALHKNGQVASVSYELISAAAEIGGDLHTALLSDSPDAMAAELAGRSGGKVLSVGNPELGHFNDEIYAKVLAELIQKHGIQVVLAPATFYGRALLGRLAGMMGGKMTSEVIGIKADGETLNLTRPCYGGSVINQVTAGAGGDPHFVTVRPKIFPEAQAGAGEVVAESVSDSCFGSRMTVKDVKSETAGVVNLAEADVIVAAGRGIKGPEHIEMVKDLAKSLHAAFGASRAIVDAGWTEYQFQVGQTGRTVNPKLYFAVGISGAIQHLVGMRSAQYIVAVNKDKDAPIFSVANYGIVGDLFEVVPALTKKFSAELSG